MNVARISSTPPMTEEAISYEQILRKGGTRAIRETSGYFEKRGSLFHALHRLVEQLNAKGIPYAVLGALAMTQHGHARMTEDIDVLLTPTGLEQFRQKLMALWESPGCFPDLGVCLGVYTPTHTPKSGHCHGNFQRPKLSGRGYRPAFEGAKKSFRDTENGVRLDIVTTGEYPGDGLPNPYTTSEQFPQNF